jgi:hypothetical protein
MKDFLIIIVLFIIVLMLGFCTRMNTNKKPTEYYSNDPSIYTLEELQALEKISEIFNNIGSNEQCKNYTSFCVKSVKECNSQNLKKIEPCKSSMKFCEDNALDKECTPKDTEIQKYAENISDKEKEELEKALKILQKSKERMGN